MSGEDPRPAPPSTVEGGAGSAVAHEVAEEIAARSRFQGGRRTIVSLALFMVLWEVFARLTPPFVAPQWSAILEAMLALNPRFVLITAARVLFALVLSFVVGAFGAVLLYAARTLEDYVLPIVKLLMAVPVISWVIFTILWFATVEYRIAFVLTIVCTPIFLIDILDALKGIPKHQREMVMSFRPSRRQYYAKLLLPATVPGVLTSWKINISLAIRVVTIAELVGAVSGIGYGLVIAKELFSMATVFAWTVVLVIMLLLAQVVVDLIERRLLAWRD
jgi:NitT/TauT family transport system permease protein